MVDTSNLKDAFHMVLVNSEYVFSRSILHESLRLGGESARPAYRTRRPPGTNPVGD